MKKFIVFAYSFYCFLSRQNDFRWLSVPKLDFLVKYSLDLAQNKSPDLDQTAAYLSRIRCMTFNELKIQRPGPDL